jgi:hypothetical protein
MNAKIELKGNRKMMEFMNNYIEINDEYRIILVYKIRNSNLNRNIFVKHAIINFEVTKYGL